MKTYTIGYFFYFIISTNCNAQYIISELKDSNDCIIGKIEIAAMIPKIHPVHQD
jgi:hypothetical protein